MSEDSLRALLSALDEVSAPPDPQFVARLRHQVREAATADVGSPIPTISQTSGEPIMVQVETEQASPMPRPRARLAVVAGVALVAGIALVTFLATRDDKGSTRLEANDAAVSIPATGIGQDDAAAEAFAVVEAAYAAHEAGDVEAWFAARSAGSVFGPGVEKRELEKRAAIMALGEHFEIDSCVSDGFGDWPDLVPRGVDLMDSGAIVTGYRFACDIVATNQFHGAGGLAREFIEYWVIADGSVVAALEAWEVDADRAATDALESKFHLDFRAWLAEAHPGLFREIRFDNGIPTEESAPAALEYVDQFVEESPDWPISP